MFKLDCPEDFWQNEGKAHYRIKIYTTFWVLKGNFHNITVNQWQSIVNQNLQMVEQINGNVEYPPTIWWQPWFWSSLGWSQKKKHHFILHFFNAHFFLWNIPVSFSICKRKKGSQNLLTLMVGQPIQALVQSCSVPLVPGSLLGTPELTI